MSSVDGLKLVFDRMRDLVTTDAGGAVVVDYVAGVCDGTDVAPRELARCLASALSQVLGETTEGVWGVPRFAARQTQLVLSVLINHLRSDDSHADHCGRLLASIPDPRRVRPIDRKLRDRLAARPGPPVDLLAPEVVRAVAAEMLKRHYGEPLRMAIEWCVGDMVDLDPDVPADPRNRQVCDFLNILYRSVPDDSVICGPDSCPVNCPTNGTIITDDPAVCGPDGCQPGTPDDEMMATAERDWEMAECAGEDA